MGLSAGLGRVSGERRPVARERAGEKKGNETAQGIDLNLIDSGCSEFMQIASHGRNTQQLCNFQRVILQFPLLINFFVISKK
jgi:hypothetical protein